MESAEHAWIGDQISLHFPTNSAPAKGFPLSLPLSGLPSGAHLTYGQIVALAGDFYGLVGTPISTAANRKAAFMAAFNSLGGDWNQTQAILAIMAEEIAAVDAALAAKKDPSTAYATLGDSLSLRWNVVTGGANVGELPVEMGRYLQLAAENWDHFTEYAVAAYSAGHELAMEYAAQSGGLSPAESTIRMHQAYALNAFADHFLTDLFSAGHLRAPRRELYTQVATPVPGMSGTMGSLLVRCMHDEDSHNGLKVTNAAGNSWVAYGDKRLLDGVGKDNRAMVVQAAQASVDDVWNAHLGKPYAYTALSYIPDLARVVDVSTKENFSPLFRTLSVGGVVQRRNDVTNRNDFSWTPDWWGWSTWAAIKGMQASAAFTPVKCYSLASGTFLGWLGVGTNNYVVLVGDENSAAALDWYVYNDEVYLRKNTSPAYRYLGEGLFSYADWGLWGGNYKSPVVYNADSTVSLKGTDRKLYLYKDNQLCWSNGEANLNYIRVDLPLGSQ